MSVSWIEFLVIGIYLLFLIGIGIAFRKLNDNIDDYFRSGCQGTWWLVGMSSFMAGAGSGTFVAGAWTSYEYGMSGLVLMAISASGALIHALFLAKWLRQLRLITGPEVVCERYTVGLQQFYAYSGVLLALWGSGIGLWAVAIFCSSMFGLPVVPTLIVTGLIVLFYSTVGGKWAVMGTDFIQGLILIPITFLASIICYNLMGGWSGIQELMAQQDLQEIWRPVKDTGEIAGDNFSLPFYGAYAILLVGGSISLGGATRYFSAKDGKAALGSAWVFFIFYAISGVLWTMPAWAGRLIFHEEVMALGIDRPGEGAFAVASREVLPLGLTGLMMTAILAAAMSTLDSGINANAAQIVRDIYPRLCSLFGWKPKEGKALLTMSKVISIVLGFFIIGIALLLTLQEQLSFFDVFVYFGALFGVPMGIPLIMGLLVWNTPPWAGYVSMGAAAVPSAYQLIASNFEALGLTPLIWHELVYTVFFTGVVVHLCTIPFFKKSPQEYKDRVKSMRKRMLTPVDYEKEVGEHRDESQLRIMGWFSMAVAIFIVCLLLIPNDMMARLQILGMAAGISIIAGILIIYGKRAAKREAERAAKGLQEHHAPVEGGELTDSAPR